MLEYSPCKLRDLLGKGDFLVDPSFFCEYRYRRNNEYQGSEHS